MQLSNEYKISNEAPLPRKMKTNKSSQYILLCDELKDVEKNGILFTEITILYPIDMCKLLAQPYKKTPESPGFVIHPSSDIKLI